MKVLLFRTYDGFTGGHLKLAQIGERLARWGHDVGLHFNRPPLQDADFPWGTGTLAQVVNDPDGFQPQLLVLAGEDWTSAEALAASGLPVIHFVQGFRPLRPPLDRFLARAALRITTSPQVAEALLAHPFLNGPVHCVPNHLDPLVWQMAVRDADAPGPSLILGYKQPTLAAATAQLLQARMPQQAVDLVLAPLARKLWLQRLAQSRVAILLPQADEGFHLPALEAMRLGVAVVTTDAIGNRWHCRDGQTARVVDAQAQNLAVAAEALVRDHDLRKHLVRGGAALAATVGPLAEDQAWAQVLAQAGAPWSAAGPLAATGGA